MTRLLDRPGFRAAIERGLESGPAVALLGPRQCGKTTLARMLAADTPATFFDLEREADRQRLENPEFSLGALDGLVIIDEIQRQPALFETLRVLLDRPKHEGQFLLLGSASPDIVRGVSETLAGRVSFVDLSGFTLGEVPRDQALRLWRRGGFPRSFLAKDEASSVLWREGFIRTFLERDLPQLGVTIPAETLRRFWTMLAHYHGQIWNAAELARALGRSESTGRRYLDLLTGAFMVRQLQPWHENLKKRQVKAPKVYVRDTGLLHTLLTLESQTQLVGHPKVGASWEGFIVEQLLSIFSARSTYFWATYGGAELDVLTMVGGKRFGFEVKYTDAPRTTRSLRVALQDLSLERAFIVYPGSKSYALDERIEVLAMEDLPARCRELRRGTDI